MRSLICCSLFVVAACGKSAPSFTVKGDVSVNGKPAKVTGCKRVRGDDGSYTLFTLDAGVQFYWDMDTFAMQDGKAVKLECSGGELDANGSKGTWNDSCQLPDGSGLKFDLDFDCR